MVHHVFKAYQNKIYLKWCAVYLSRATKLIVQSYLFLQPVYQDVLQHKPTVEHVVPTARDLLKDEEPSEKDEVFEKSVDDLERRWNDVYDVVNKRYSQIQRILPNAADYAKELSDVTPWLNDAEKKQASVPTLSANPEQLNQRKRELKVNEVAFSGIA